MLGDKGIPARDSSEAQAAQPRFRPLDYASLDDDGLVRLVVVQDMRALEALYARYSRPIFSLALKILSDREAVEEVVQEVFLRLWTRAQSYDPQRGKLLSWLLTITHHRAIDELRRRRGLPDMDGLQEQLASTEEVDASPAASLDNVVEREVVQQALGQLPESQRRPIEMAYYGGLTQVEIAQSLREPLGTIKTRMRLGMQKLRLILAGHGETRERLGSGTA